MSDLAGKGLALVVVGAVMAVEVQQVVTFNATVPGAINGKTDMYVGVTAPLLVRNHT